MVTTRSGAVARQNTGMGLRSRMQRLMARSVGIPASQSRSEPTSTSADAQDILPNGDGVSFTRNSATNTTDITPVARTGFRDLPAELRNEIYQTVRPAGYIEINRSRLPSIAYVNKQIHHEWMDFFHENSHFMLHLGGIGEENELDHLRRVWDRWVTRLGDENAKRVRHLVFYSPDRGTVKLVISKDGKIAMKLRGGSAERKEDRYDEKFIRTALDSTRGMKDRRRMLMRIGASMLIPLGRD